MATDITTINISLPKRLRADIERKVERESYSSVSEYVRDLIRRDLRARAVDEIDASLLEGLSSGEPVPVRPGFWKKLKAEATKTRRRA
jgi:putative addiction module CopG family antidote